MAHGSTLLFCSVAEYLAQSLAIRGWIPKWSNGALNDAFLHTTYRVLQIFCIRGDHWHYMGTITRDLHENEHSWFFPNITYKLPLYINPVTKLYSNSLPQNLINLKSTGQNIRIVNHKPQFETPLGFVFEHDDDDVVKNGENGGDEEICDVKNPPPKSTLLAEIRAQADKAREKMSINKFYEKKRKEVKKINQIKREGTALFKYVPNSISSRGAYQWAMKKGL